MSRPRDIARILGKTEAANPDNKSLSANDGSTTGLVVYDSSGLLPSSGLTAGSQAYVTANNRLYISNGVGWFSRALINATPALSLSSSGTIALATDGTPTTITMTATDSDNSDANLVLSLESGGDLFKFATVSQDSSVVTITPRSSDSATALGYDGSATLTFKASDGISVASVQNTFTLSFTVTYDLPSNSNHVRTNSVSGTAAGETVLSGIAFNSAGNRFWTCSYASDNIVEYTLATAWDTSSTLTQVSTNYTDTTVGSNPSPNGLHYDGRYLWMGTAGTSPSRLAIFDLGVGGTMSTNQSVLGTVTFPSSPNPYGMFVGKGGTKIYVGNATPSPDTILEYTINSSGAGAVDAIANGLTLTSSVNAPNDSIEDMAWNPQGTQFFLLCRGSGGTGISIFKYTASTAWDITSLTQVGEVTRASITAFSNNDVRGIFLREDGGNTFIAQQSSGNIHTFAT